MCVPNLVTLAGAQCIIRPSATECMSFMRGTDCTRAHLHLLSVVGHVRHNLAGRLLREGRIVELQALAVDCCHE
jgi:hypothetical protein